MQHTLSGKQPIKTSPVTLISDMKNIFGTSSGVKKVFLLVKQKQTKKIKQKSK